MFVRLKKTPNSPKTSVQIVESKRVGPDLAQKHHKKLRSFPIYGKRRVGSILSA